MRLLLLLQVRHGLLRVLRLVRDGALFRGNLLHLAGRLLAVQLHADGERADVRHAHEARLERSTHVGGAEGAAQRHGLITVQMHVQNVTLQALLQHLLEHRYADATSDHLHSLQVILYVSCRTDTYDGQVRVLQRLQCGRHEACSDRFAVVQDELARGGGGEVALLEERALVHGKLVVH